MMPAAARQPQLQPRTPPGDKGARDSRVQQVASPENHQILSDLGKRCVSRHRGSTDCKPPAPASSFKHIHHCISLQLIRARALCLTVSHRVRAMVEKPVFLGKPTPCWKAVRPGRRASILAVTSLALLLFVGETGGIAEERRTTTQPSTPPPLTVPEAGDSGSDHASMNRGSPGEISGPGQASPGQWLIDDVARDRAKSEVKQGRRNSPSATRTVPNATPVDAGVGLRSLDDPRVGEHQHGEEQTTGSIAKPPSQGFGDPPSRESQTGSRATDADNGKLGAPPPHRSLGQSDEHRAAARPNASPGLGDAAANCAQAPAGQAPEGEHWYYRLDRETHRKCWYVRGYRRDESRGRRRQSTFLCTDFGESLRCALAATPVGPRIDLTGCQLTTVPLSTRLSGCWELSEERTQRRQLDWPRWSWSSTGDDFPSSFA
jgi:hypothetical protein